MSGVFAFDLVSGAAIGRLDASDVRWSEWLNGRMELTFRLDLAYEPSQDMAPSLVTDGVGVRPVKFVVHDATVTPAVSKSFILWEARYVDRRFLELRCAGLWSWFGQFPISSTLTFRSREQLDIAAYLIDWAQSPTHGGGIGVSTNGYTASGRVRDRTYNGFEYTPVGQRVTELAEVDDGFDFAVVTTFDGNQTVTDTWVPSYPRAGDTWPTSGIRIDADSAAVDLTVTSGAPTTDVREIGAGEGSTMLTATASASGLSDYPPLWRVWEPRKSVSRQSTLDSHAERDIVLANRSTEQWEATVLDEYGDLKALTVGDECQIVIGRGDYRWPNGLTVVRRITGQHVSIPDNGGPNTVQLDLEDSDLGGN